MGIDASNRPQQAQVKEAGSGYFKAHWRGEQSLARSFWVNHFLLAMPLALALTGLMGWISVKGQSLQISAITVLIGWPLFLIIDTWCVVGAWRAVRGYLEADGSRLWALLARLLLALGALQICVSVLLGFGPEAREYWQMARGIDPIGHAAFKLDGEGHSLQFSGPIGMGDAARLQKLLATAPALRRIDLDSPGGRVHEAEQMVALIKKSAYVTRAVGSCESACTLVFLAAKERQLMPGAQLGFHRASSGTYNPLFDEMANKHLAAIYRDIGLPDDFISRTLSTPSHSMWYPRSDELARHALIAPLPHTLDLSLPAGDKLTVADYGDALRASPIWYALDRRFAGLVEGTAGRLHAAAGRPDLPTDRAERDAALQLVALQSLGERMPELILGGSPELRRQYLSIVRAQLSSLHSSPASGAACEALMAGHLGLQRSLPPALQARHTAWVVQATEAPVAGRLPARPSAIELEVAHRALGRQAPGMLSGLWPLAASATVTASAVPHPARCDAALQILDSTARLPAAQRELLERLLFQPSRGA